MVLLLLACTQDPPKDAPETTDTGEDTAADSAADSADDTAPDSGEDSAPPDDDGDGWTVGDGDCDDTRADVSPGAAEVCDEVDNDCDGAPDDADPEGPADPATWYADVDGDRYGDGAAPASACEVPAGHVANATDCDDAAPAVNPVADEMCNGIDDDCDGDADDDEQDGYPSDRTSYYEDLDGDGYGTSFSGSACVPPDGTAVADGDCDDTRADVSPGAAEVCDDADNDCDGLVDGRDGDLTGAPTWYADADGDGFGDPSSPDVSCTGRRDYVSDGTDCDDADADVNPGGVEVCGGSDDDCDGLVDDDDSDAVGNTPSFADVDADGHGDPASYTLRCDVATGDADNGHDCDDADPTTWACPDSPDDGTVCADQWGTDLGGPPAWTGTCNEEIGLVAFEDSCYWEGSGNVALADARATCAAAGGWLATMSSTREDEHLLDLTTQVWLGGCSEDGEWRWFSGEGWAHQRWWGDEPDGTGDCLGSYNVASFTWRWEDQSCTTTSAWVCEFGEPTVAAEEEEAPTPDCATPTLSAEAGSFTLTFDADIEEDTLADGLSVHSEARGALSGSTTWSDGTATWTPDEALSSGDVLSATVSDAARCTDGGTVTPWTWAWDADATAGTGSFSVGTASGSMYALGLLLRDFDGDGDVEAATLFDSEVEILDDLETGTVTTLDTLPADGTLRGFATLDADADGDLDIAVADETAMSVRLWLNDGDGTFTQGEEEVFDPDLPQSIVAADLDRDGDEDLAVGTQYIGMVAFLRDDGGGDLALRGEWEGTDYSQDLLAAGDFDGDGVPDLAADDGLRLWLGGGDVWEEGPAEASSVLAYAYRPGDYDGDGHLDLAVCGSSAYVLLGDGEGDLDEEDREGSCDYAIVAGDWDADGDLDLAALDYSGVYVLANDGTGNIRQTDTLAPGFTAYSLAAGDVDGDGAIDLVAAGTQIVVLWGGA